MGLTVMRFFSCHIFYKKNICLILVFNNHTVEAAWCNTVDVNIFDYNPIIGQHPYWHSIYLFCGFGGHGLAQMFGAADYFSMNNFNPTFHITDNFRNDWRYRQTSLDIDAYSLGLPRDI